MSRRKRRAAKTLRFEGPGVALVALAALILGVGCAVRPAAMNDSSHQGLSPTSGGAKAPSNHTSQNTQQSIQSHTTDPGDATQPTAPEVPLSPGARIAAAKRSIEDQSVLLWGGQPPGEDEQNKQTLPTSPETPPPDPAQIKPKTQTTEEPHDATGSDPNSDAVIDPQTDSQTGPHPKPAVYPTNLPLPVPPLGIDPPNAENPDAWAAHCAQTCDAASGICESSEAICEIAEDHPLDETFQVDCAWADQVCTRAQDTCADCQAAH